MSFREIGGVIGFLALDSTNAKIYEDGDVIEVLDYKMVYYNPWDAQYLVVDYGASDYEAEMSRLEAIGTMDYQGCTQKSGR